jgi:hypothetical protein
MAWPPSDLGWPRRLTRLLPDRPPDGETIRHFRPGAYHGSSLLLLPVHQLSGILAKYVSSALVLGSPGAYDAPPIQGVSHG